MHRLYCNLLILSKLNVMMILKKHFKYAII